MAAIASNDCGRAATAAMVAVTVATAATRKIGVAKLTHAKCQHSIQQKLLFGSMRAVVSDDVKS
jgi:hypothetical protein